MPLMSTEVKSLISRLDTTFISLIKDVPSFTVLNKEILPYGLKQHTRSICWLAEQVILQNIKKRMQQYGLSSYEDPESDISAWDAKLGFGGMKEPSFVNIKVSDVTKPARKNDIASVKKLLKFYEDFPNAHLFYVVLMLEFDGNIIHFRRTPIIRYYPWVGDFVVNPRNHHIQSVYESSTLERTTDAFLKQLCKQAREKNVL
jgi:hypothetical protein